MTEAVPIGLAWRPVEVAPSPGAVVAHGEVARRLRARLAALPSARRELLEVTAAPGWLVVIGAGDELPWADGVRYAAPSTLAPGLWLPTHVEPDVPHDLLARALQRRHARQPMLLWPDPAVAWPLDRAQPASDTVLAAISAAWSRGEAGGA
jgi:hypothetical protein